MDQSNEKVVHTERTFITAELARRWLKLNLENNRQLNQERVNSYSRDMKAGKWRENGDPVRFSEDGSLIDGQHRLHASVQCGVGFWSQVAYGIKKEAFITIDRNQPRSRGQVLRLDSGLADQNAVAATLAWLYRFKDGIMMARSQATDSEIAQLLLEHPGVKESIAAARKVLHQFKAGSVSLVAVCHYLFMRQDETLAELFFDSLAKGVGLREVDPVYQLRKRLISSAAAGRKIEAHSTIALYFKTWLAEREQRTLNKLEWQASDNFPNIGPIGTAKMRPEMVKQMADKSKSGRKARKTKKEKASAVPVTINKAHAPTRLDQLIAKHRGVDRIVKVR